MQNIDVRKQPIQTSYNGYRFRSRLEARWAVFFDAANIKYEYEPEGFTGMNGIHYLPDFYLPDFDVYAEVKGTDEQLNEDALKINAAIDWKATPIAEKGLIILGPIPYKEWSVPYFDFLFWHKGVCSTKCLFDVPEPGIALFYHGDKMGERCRRDFAVYGIENKADVGDPLPPSVSVNAKYANYDTGVLLCMKRPFQNLNKCYEAARSARFEHGETPLIT